MKYQIARHASRPFGPHSDLGYCSSRLYTSEGQNSSTACTKKILYFAQSKNEVPKSSCNLGLVVLIMVLVLCRRRRLLSFETPVSHVMCGIVEVKRDASKEDKSDYWLTQRLAWYHRLPCPVDLRRAHLSLCPQAALFVFQDRYLYALLLIIDLVRLLADPP